MRQPIIKRFRGGKFVDDYRVVQFDAEDREKWLELRQKDVTASVVGALFGVHPFVTYFGLYRRKAGLAVERNLTNGAIERGIELEPIALRRLQAMKPDWTVDWPKIYFRAPGLRVGATPDAYAVDPTRKGFGIVQIKSVALPVFREDWRNQAGRVEVPPWIQLQAILEAKLTGASWAMVGALTVNYAIDLELVEVPIHEGVWERLKEEVALFWQRIKDGRTPRPDYMRDAEEIAGIWPQDNGRTIDFSDDQRLAGMLERAEALGGEIRKLKNEQSALLAEVRHKLGPNEVGTLPGWKITAKSQEAKGYWVPGERTRPLRYRRVKTTTVVDEGDF